jgi:hypothetical protein
MTSMHTVFGTASLSAWTDWLSPWNWASSDWAGLTFVVLLVAAFVAWQQVKEAQGLRREQDRLRKEQARPFVIIDFHLWKPIIELIIKNVGATLARKVLFEFNPPLTTTHDDMPGRGNLMDLNLFKHGIPSLAPGKEITLFFDEYLARNGRNLPQSYEVQVSYEDTVGDDYTELMVLDLAMYLGTGGVTRHGLHDIHKRMEEISGSLKKWTDYAGLKVLTAGDLRRRRVENDALFAEREEATSAAEEPTAPSGDTSV